MTYALQEELEHFLIKLIFTVLSIVFNTKYVHQKGIDNTTNSK